MAADGEISMAIDTLARIRGNLANSRYPLELRCLPLPPLSPSPGPTL